MARMIASCEASAAGSSPTMRPRFMTRMRFAHPEQLGHLRGDDQNALPLGGEVVDDRIDLVLGADIDAAGRLVEDQHVRVGEEPLAQNVPSAGCRPTGSPWLADARGSGCAGARGSARPRPARGPRRSRPSPRRRGGSPARRWCGCPRGAPGRSPCGPRWRGEAGRDRLLDAPEVRGFAPQARLAGDARA